MAVFQRQFGFITLTALALLMALDGAALAQHVAPPLHSETGLAGLLSNRIIPYGRNHNTPVFADYVPLTAETTAPLRIKMARSEYEPLQVGIYVPSGQAGLSTVQVSVASDIPYEVGHLHYAPSPDWLEGQDVDWPYKGRRRAMPSYLVPGATIPSIASGRSGGYWITFKTDASTPAGIHIGQITITADGVSPFVKAISVEVYPFELPRPKPAFGIFYFIDRVCGTDIDPALNPPYRTKRYQEMYLADIAAHGHNSVLMRSFLDLFGSDEYIATGHATLPENWETSMFYDHYRRALALLDPSEYADGKVDPARLIEEQIALYQNAGVIYPDVPVLAFGGYGFDNKTTAADTMRSLSVDNDWPEFVHYQRDEPLPWVGDNFTQETIEDILQWKRIENVRNLTCIAGNSVVSWGKIYDIWVVLAGHVSEGMMAEARRQHAEVWTYTFDLSYVNPHLNRYWTGLYMWGLGLTGNYPNSPYQQGNLYEVNPTWNVGSETASIHQPQGYTISGVDGPVPGVGWEGRREGIDDYRYLQLLEARLAATADPNPLKDAAQAWLDDLKSTVLTSINKGVLSDRHQIGDLHSYDWYNPDPDHNPDEYRGIRETVATYIAQFAPAPGELNPPTVPASYPLSGWEGADYDGSPIGECVTALQSGTTAQKRAAATALSIRPDGAAALSALADLLDDPDVRIPALAALSQLESAAAPANQTVAPLLQNTDGFVRLASTRAMEATGAMEPKWFLAALSDPFPLLSGTTVEYLWKRGRIDQATVLSLMDDSSQWEFSYEADKLPTNDGWTLFSDPRSFVPPEPCAVMLPAAGGAPQILELGSLSGAEDGYEKNWTLCRGDHFSYETRMKLREAAACAEPQIVLRARHVTESSLRLTGTPGATKVVWSLGTNDDAYPDGYSHSIDVTQWHTYRVVMTHTDSNVEGKLYIDGNPEPVLTRTVSWALFGVAWTPRNHAVIVPGGNSAVLRVDYLRWTTLDGAGSCFAPAAKTTSR